MDFSLFLNLYNLRVDRKFLSTVINTVPVISCSTKKLYSHNSEPKKLKKKHVSETVKQKRS